IVKQSSFSLHAPKNVNFLTITIHRASAALPWPSTISGGSVQKTELVKGKVLESCSSS
ncbi:unnamed protein product, partial [Brassica rapa subsp. trilocularis]